MAIQRWDPIRDLMQLQERMNRLFEEALARSTVPGPNGTPAAAGWKPPLDLYEEPERYVLRVDLPGIGPGEVELRVEDGQLSLCGERRIDGAVPRDAYLRVERPHGRFQVQLTLPPSVDWSGIQATHGNGVLEISLPKRRERTVTRMPIAVT